MKTIFNSLYRKPKIGEVITIVELHETDDYFNSPNQNKNIKGKEVRYDEKHEKRIHTHRTPHRHRNHRHSRLDCIGELEQRSNEGE